MEFEFFFQHKMEREWILHVLEEGMSDGQCFDLCDKQGIFQILLGFSSSPLCDEHCQVFTKVPAEGYNETMITEKSVQL